MTSRTGHCRLILSDFSAANPVATASGNSNFFCRRRSWKATGPTELQLQSGNSRFFEADRVGRGQGCNCSLRTRGLFGGRRR